MHTTRGGGSLGGALVGMALLVAVLAGALPVAAQSGEASSDGWRQWGGPSGDFRTEDLGLQARWPEQGPTELWRRPLGPGHSSILVDEGRLFTMYRPGARANHGRRKSESWRSTR